jgi:hypothetical protein
MVFIITVGVGLFEFLSLSCSLSVAEVKPKCRELNLFLNPFNNLDGKKQPNPYPIQKKLFCFQGAKISAQLNFPIFKL